MASNGKGRFQRWLEQRDRSNQATMDATRPPPMPGTPGVVLQALTTIPDPAFAYRLRLLIDGQRIDGVPWGWSVHPLALGKHTLELFHRSGPLPRASRVNVEVTLDAADPVKHVFYSATAMGFRRGQITVAPYERQGGTRSDDQGGASPA